jgi:(1->4)-alpha-D-glucan 1-alpha-D-glucosylmutase
VLASGPAAEHVVAFRRGQDVAVAVSRWTVRLPDGGWRDTVVALPPGTWADTLSGAEHNGPVPAAELFATLPVALLERVDD